MFGFYRLYLAVIVALYHYQLLPIIGQWAVVSFFVLSGFLMTIIMNESYGYSLIGVKKYATNRWLRLFPSYYFVALISVAVFVLFPLDTGRDFLPDTLGEAFANATMLFPSLHPGDYYPRLVPPTWALTIEIVFYALIAFGISRSKHITVCWFFLSIAYLGLVSGFTRALPSIDYSSLMSSSLPFSAGALMYHYRPQMQQFLDRLNIVSPLVLTCLFVVNQALVAASEWLFASEAWKLVFVASYVNLGLSCAMIVCLFQVKPSAKLKHFDDLLGKYSYPVYLSHVIAAIIAVRVFGIDRGETPSLQFLLAASLMCFVLSALCVHGIDGHVEKLRSRIKQSKALT